MMELLKNFRDGVAYSFAWLVLCVIMMACALGNEAISVSFLLKLLVLCLWASLSFVISFRVPKIRKRGFMVSLTCFYLLFLPVEIFLFYAMGIFQGTGSPVLWITFVAIVFGAYLLSLMIDAIVMKRKAVEYTKHLENYQKIKALEK
ncbi:MAG: hypothetical protein IKO03_07085 [Lachnospiraceae bacterium]|nr:hypothetical protein [Lachnospiraceae bacterium]MBR3508513.1 hypothetical protein [Lachnospiraceae bacterium]MBR4605911.1 hypothetical protein [Lachnospiraceae bacterium]MBR6151170.1 hypothetical protein [Lachnospiraceae bacterium]